MTEFERTRFFFGQLLTAEDLQREQRYHMDRRRLLNRMLVGYGVVQGLDVAPAGGGRVKVEPGFAIDPQGRELLVCTAEHRPVPARGRFSACLSYAEVETPHGTIRETFELTVDRAGKEPQDAVVLARLRHARGALVVEKP